MRDDQTKGNAKFIAYTDQKSDVWETRKPCDLFKDPTRNAKIHKVLIHKYTNGTTLWIDGNVAVKIEPEKLLEWLKGYDIAVFEHFERNVPMAEIDACLKSRKGDPDKLEEQRKEAKGVTGLWECNMILRRDNKKVRTFNEAWWTEICRYSKRDQISFAYLMNRFNLKVNTLEGNVREHAYFDYKRHLK